MAQNGGVVLLQEIQDVLKADVPPSDSSEVSKLFHSLKQFLKQEAEERAVEDIVTEIEKALGATTTESMGQEIGKALNSLKNLDKNGGVVLLQEIQDVLKVDVPPSDSSEVAKLFHLLKQFLKQEAEERAVEDIVTEIEKALGATTTESMGQEIGKALNSLKNLDKNGGMDLLQEIQDVLKADVPPSDSSEVAKLFHSLKQFLKHEAEERAVDPLTKAFVEYAKNTATAYATSFNAVNIFASSVSFVIGDDNEKYKMLKKHTKIHTVFIAMTLGFLPVSLLTVGMSHALTHKLQWKKKVAVMLMAEVVYMAVMCTLFGIYLMPGSNETLAVVFTCFVAFLSLIAVPWSVFKVPSDHCFKLVSKCWEFGKYVAEHYVGPS